MGGSAGLDALLGGGPIQQQPNHDAFAELDFSASNQVPAIEQ